jgi:uncharacterized OsmC-like protein
MLHVPIGGVLEMRSREPTVADELPPWCRMVGHDFLGALRGPRHTRYFLRRGAGAAQDAPALAEDKARARAYEWRLRARSTGPQQGTVYSRNHAFTVGQAASFEERDPHPSAVEYLLGALAASLVTGLATEAARAGLDIDDVEISLRGSLANPLAILGLEAGEPALDRIALKCFASSPEDEAAVRAAWELAVARSPIAATLARAVNLDITLAVL